MVDRSEFVRTVRGYLGTPYSHQGRTPGERLDCIGTPLCALKEHAWQPRDAARVATLDYAPAASDGTLESVIAGEGLPVPGVPIQIADLQIGDLLLFRWPREPHAHHCGVVSQVIGGTFYFVHAYNCATQLSVCETAFRDAWRARCVGAYRLFDFCT